MIHFLPKLVFGLPFLILAYIVGPIVRGINE